MPTARRNSNHSQPQPRRPNNAQPQPPPPPPRDAPVYIGGPNWPDHLRTNNNRRRRHGGGGGDDNVNGGRGGGGPWGQQGGVEREVDLMTIEDELRERFNKEPDSVILRATGWTICLPKYNGVAWWYPKNTITTNTTTTIPQQQQPHHPLEAALCRMFCFVEAMQTILLFAWPLSLAWDFGLLRAIASILLTVPIGSHLEDRYGSNHGNAVTCLYALYLTFHVMSSLYAWGVVVVAPDTTTNPNPLVFLGFFLLILYGIGNIMCMMEKHVIGRTWFAAIVVYTQLAVWIHRLVSIIITWYT